MKELLKSISKIFHDSLNTFNLTFKNNNEIILPTEAEIYEFIKTLDGCMKYRNILWQKRAQLAGKLSELEKPADFDEPVNYRKIAYINNELIQINSDLAGLEMITGMRQQLESINKLNQ